MYHFVDLYAKLLIGTFTFIGPSFTLLISLFSRQLDNVNLTNKEQLNNLIAFDTPTSEILQVIHKNRKLINLLNPKRQIIRLYGSLLASITGVAFFYLQNMAVWKIGSRGMRIATLLTSFCIFLYCLFTLWQLFCVIIDAKRAEKITRKPADHLLQTKDLLS